MRNKSTRLGARRFSLKSTALALIGAGSLVLAGAPASAYAATPAGATFTFSGSLSGTLHLSASGCAGASGAGGQFEFYGKLKGMSGATSFYTVTATDAHKNGGTWTKFPPNSGVAVVLEAQIKNVGYVWIATSGKLSTKGTTGDLNVGVVPEKSPLSGKPGKGDVRIKGSWSCEAF